MGGPGDDGAVSRVIRGVRMCDTRRPAAQDLVVDETFGGGLGCRLSRLISSC